MTEPMLLLYKIFLIDTGPRRVVSCKILEDGSVDIEILLFHNSMPYIINLPPEE